MGKTALWHVENNAPYPLQESGFDLEKQLEEWIENNPGLLRGGLTIVGRQFRTASGPIDLLAIDPVGRWVVIELKPSSVRRETIAQALDYAACIRHMPHEELLGKVKKYLSSRKLPIPDLQEEEDDGEREVMMMVVGKGREPGLDKMVEFMATDYQVPISVVSYEVFELGNGERIILRELTDADFQPQGKPKAKRQAPTLDDLCDKADKRGIGEQFRALRAVAERHGLHCRTYPHSVMYSPPNNKTRMLYTVWTHVKDGKLSAYVSPPAFAEFYPIREDIALDELGPEGGRTMNNDDVTAFVNGLDRLFKKIENVS
jgi:Holliday junction resolvase-like predicted endonuclease